VTDPFIAAQLDKLPDFWRRREAAAAHAIQFEAFGHPVHLSTNDPQVLQAARLCAARYSRSDCEAPRMQLHVLVDRQLGHQPLPQDWPTQLRGMGVGQWLTVNRDPWVNAFADTSSRTAVALVSGSLAREPYYLSRYICDRFILNLVMGEELGRLHASCLVRDHRAVLLSGPNNSGKSTTALRLALAGYGMVSDGMTHIRVHPTGLELLGYPVGETKLRHDVLGWFPALAAVGRSVAVGEHTKIVLDLRKVDHVHPVADSVRPREFVLAHLALTPHEISRSESISTEEMLRLVWPEASFVEGESAMQRNLRVLRRLLKETRCYRLEIGSDPASLLETIDRL